MVLWRAMADLRPIAAHTPPASRPSDRPTPRPVTPSQRPTRPEPAPPQRRPAPTSVTDAIGANLDVRV
jgi:hypothetical protein